MHRASGYIVVAMLLVAACGGGSDASAESTTQAVTTSAAPVASVVQSAASATAVPTSVNLTSVASTTTAASSPPPATPTRRAITTSATSRPSAAASSGGAGTGQCVHSKYFPIKNNNQWVYQSTQTASGKPTQTTQTIVDVTPTSFGMSEQLEGHDAVDVHWNCSASGLASTTLDLGGDSSSSPTSKMTMTITNETGVWIPPDADWSIGKKWSVSYDVTMTLPTVTVTGNATSSATSVAAGSKGTVTIDFTIVSQEPVTVPAGTFTNAFKVHEITTEKLTMVAAGVSIPMNVTVDTDVWFAANVGQVKSQRTVVGPNKAPITDEVLLSYKLS